MYRSYWNTNNSASRYRSSYPNYAYGYNTYGRRNFGYYDSSPYWNEYYYGGRRRRRYYWERDREIDNNYRSRRSRTRRSTSEDEDDGNIIAPERDDSPEPPKPEPPKEELVKVLNVKDVDMHIDTNAQKHRTDDYDCTSDRKVDGKEMPAELVVRRGDSFKVTITFDRPYSNEKNDIKLHFSIGKHNAPSRGTAVDIEVDESGDKKYKPDEWGANKVSASGNDVTLMVYTPANCIVGEWNMFVKSYAIGKDESGKEKTLVFKYENGEDVTILFNPWCSDDETYMNTTELNEYVLNPSGCVYRGNAWTPGAKEWNFGQFEEGIIEAALYLMRKGFKEPNSKSMSDPINVSRAIAKMVNAQDDNGVLVGNWSGEYDDGVSPSKWVGSVKILRQFMKTGPVKYGQCWVFSCLTTTVCRALGIPCRTVTNFSSAHDTDESNTIDKYFKRVNGVLEKTRVYGSSDSVWNFHVWNEVWLTRPDLDEKGFNGWQVIDATPQETSEGVYTCGPCPVVAVKKGMCDVKFDTAFVFSEVNADEVHWEVLPGGAERKLELFSKKIGKSISTKIPDGKPYREAHTGYVWNLSEKKRLDVTHEYKFPEGSEEERSAVMMAHKTARYPKPMAYVDVKKVQPIEFHLEHSNEVMIGQDLEIALTAKNTGKHDRDIKVVEFRVSPKTYTGETGKVFFRKMLGPEKLDSGKSTSFKVTLKVNEYLPHLVEQANLYIEATAVVEKVANEDEQTTLKAHDFRFRRPDLTVEVPETAKVNEKVEFVVSFTNPLPKPLTKCDISMESSGFTDIEDQTVPDVAPNGEFKKTFTLVARKHKEHTVVFSFDCETLKDITGSGSIEISK